MPGPDVVGAILANMDQGDQGKSPQPATKSQSAQGKPHVKETSKNLTRGKKTKVTAQPAHHSKHEENPIRVERDQSVKQDGGKTSDTAYTVLASPTEVSITDKGKQHAVSKDRTVKSSSRSKSRSTSASSTHSHGSNSTKSRHGQERKHKSDGKTASTSKDDTRTHKSATNKELSEIKQQVQSLTSLFTEFMPVVKQLKSAYDEANETPVYHDDEHSGSDKDTDDDYDVSDSDIASAPGFNDGVNYHSTTKQLHSDLLRAEKRAANDELSEGEIEDETPVKKKCTREQILHNLGKGLASKEDFAPGIHEEFAKKVNGLVSEGMLEDVFTEKTEKIKRPSNCPMLGPVRVNPEIWNILKPESRSRDARFQKLVSKIHKGLIPLIQLADSLMNSLGNDADQHLQIQDVLVPITDSVSILAASLHDVHKWRKEFVRPEVNEVYKGACSLQEPISDLLFGNDLSKRMQEQEESNKLSNKMAKFHNYQNKGKHTFRRSPGAGPSRAKFTQSKNIFLGNKQRYQITKAHYSQPRQYQRPFLAKKQTGQAVSYKRRPQHHT